MDKTKIDWCDSTWNPVAGCLHHCEYCYARDIANRFSPNSKEIMSAAKYCGIGNNGIYDINMPWIYDEKVEPYPFGFAPTFYRYRLNDYIGKKGKNIFVCSMADLFGSWVPENWIDEVFKACAKAPQHNYLFLTKNPARYGVLPYSTSGTFNYWYGMSATTEEELSKTYLLPEFCNTFLSIEPILENLDIVNGDLRLTCLDWVIIGAETGRRKNKVIPEKKWIKNIVRECNKNGIPVFMKSSLAEIWGEPLIQEFPEQLKGGKRQRLLKQ